MELTQKEKRIKGVIEQVNAPLSLKEIREKTGSSYTFIKEVCAKFGYEIIKKEITTTRKILCVERGDTNENSK